MNIGDKANIRMPREIKMLTVAPPPGVVAWPSESNTNQMTAQLRGPKGTVYEGGVFRLAIEVPSRYPFEPPHIRFQTPVYHPNVDTGGRICLDLLNMPPKGAWRPALNLSTLLASIGLLLAEPNPDDGLMPDVAAEYKQNRAAFDRKARQMVQQHAMSSTLSPPGGAPSQTSQHAASASTAREAQPMTEPLRALETTHQQHSQAPALPEKRVVLCCTTSSSTARKENAAEDTSQPPAAEGSPGAHVAITRTAPFSRMSLPKKRQKT